MHDENITNTSPKRRNLLGVGLALILATAAFFSGLQIGNGIGPSSQTAGLFSLFASAPQADSEADLSEFWRVWHLMDQKFTPASSTFSITAEERIQGAIDGMVASYGDPYTSYLPPADAAHFDEDISGNFSGVGMEVAMRNGVITIISPLPNTPAERAGLMSGDIIVRIDDSSTEGMGIDQAVRIIRGEEGTNVTFSILREGTSRIEQITVTRAKIEIPTVTTEKRGDTFIITLYSFNAIAEMRVQNALREYVSSGASKMILDLRGNPGGYLQSAVSIAGYFLPTGKVVLRENFGEDRSEQLYRSQGKVLKQFAPEEIVVLIDGGSASASEILAGALNQHGYAVLIGQNSFGKGSVQELVSLPEGSALKVTVARWLTPDGTSISDGGLKPDIVVERTLEQRQNNEDPQLEAALSYLAGTYVPVEESDSGEDNN